MDWPSIAFSPTISAGNWIVILMMLIGAATVAWIKRGPEQRRAENETKEIENTEAAKLRAEYDLLNKQNRTDIHDLRGQLQKVAAEQHNCEKELREARAENNELQAEALAAATRNKEEMRTMLFLIRLLISELKRLDPDSLIVRQAEDTLAHMNGQNTSGKSDALATAEGAVVDAKQTLASTRATCEEVKHSEEGSGK